MPINQPLGLYRAWRRGEKSLLILFFMTCCYNDGKSSLLSCYMRIFRTIRRRLRDSIAYHRVLSTPEEYHVYKVKKISQQDTQELMAAKMLHADVYLSKGFVGDDDVRDGVIHEKSDPHQVHSEYFVVKKKGSVVAVARQIIYKGQGLHHESFPVLEKSIIYGRSRKRLLAFHPTEIVEISALVKKSGESSVAPLILYRALWRHSIDARHRIWVMACDVRLYERLKLLFGSALTRIGQRTPYRGGDVIPVALYIPGSLKYVERVIASPRKGILDLKRRAARFMIKGMNRL